jgi:hypothetical protein
VNWAAARSDGASLEGESLGARDDFKDVGCDDPGSLLDSVNATGKGHAQLVEVGANGSDRRRCGVDGYGAFSGGAIGYGYSPVSAGDVDNKPALVLHVEPKFKRRPGDIYRYALVVRDREIISPRVPAFVALVCHLLFFSCDLRRVDVMLAKRTLETMRARLDAR